MIIEAEIICKPNSGEYFERIYDNESRWNSQNWTFIRFINDDYLEWYGHFRGFPKVVAVSKARDIILVLTSDYLYQLDRQTGNVTDFEDQPYYQSLTITPDGDFILSDDYHLEKITGSIKDKKSIESPIQMDTVKFGNWDNTKLQFTCNEFANWERHLTMTYDNEKNKIEIENG